MKKNLLFFVLLVLCPVLKADGVRESVTFTLVKNFYSDVEKKYENDTSVFYYTNKLLSMNLTNAELKSILSQKSGSGSARLTYYETLKIDVEAVPGTPFESLERKSTFYRANGGGAWVSDIIHNQNIEETAKVFNLNNAFWPYGFKLQYRTDTTGTYISTVPAGKDLTNKTLEEQLATVLDLDLTANDNAVVEQYNILWRFNPLPEGYKFLLRFDFLDNKDTSPTLKSGTTDEYLTSLLNNMATKYVAIVYNRTGSLPTSLEVEESNNKKEIFIFIPILAILITSGIVIYKKIVI